MLAVACWVDAAYENGVKLCVNYSDTGDALRANLT